MLLHHITTSWPGGVRRQERGCVPSPPDAEGRENDLINPSPRLTDQIWEGFGAAVTDSAGFVYSLMAPEQQETFLRRCFDPDGLGYRLVRVPVDSCDFSLETYEAAPGGDLGRFSMERAGRYILPLLEDIRRTAPHPVRLMLSPWSPPAAFKSNGERCHGGRCLRQYWRDWAEYLCRYIEEFEARGFEVARISLQNEPKAVQNWDSCLWSAEEERDFLVQEMKPALLRHGLDRVEVFLWDHNKERVLDRALAILDEEAGPCADGLAFHWYSGDHFEALELLHRAFPEKKLILSESCLEYSKLDVSNPAANVERVAHEILGDLRGGMSAFYDWNLLLDRQGGPNHVGNFCHAPVLYDREAGTLLPQNLYDGLWHFARFLQPGSVRIGSSCCTADLEHAAFRRPDGSLLLVVLNRTGQGQDRFLRLEEQLAPQTFPAHSLTTLLITPDGVQPL